MHSTRKSVIYDHVYIRDVLFTVDGAEVNYINIHVSSFSNFEHFSFIIYVCVCVCVFSGFFIYLHIYLTIVLLNVVHIILILSHY
jgi:hypothetical protein